MPKLHPFSAERGYRHFRRRSQHPRLGLLALTTREDGANLVRLRRVPAVDGANPTRIDIDQINPADSKGRFVSRSAESGSSQRTA